MAIAIALSETFECSICLEDHENNSSYKTPCNHEFGIMCLLKWVNTQRLEPSCPNCRQPLDRDDIQKFAIKFNPKISGDEKLTFNDLLKMRGVQYICELIVFDCESTEWTEKLKQLLVINDYNGKITNLISLKFVKMDFSDLGINPPLFVINNQQYAFPSPNRYINYGSMRPYILLTRCADKFKQFDNWMKSWFVNHNEEVKSCISYVNEQQCGNVKLKFPLCIQEQEYVTTQNYTLLDGTNENCNTLTIDQFPKYGIGSFVFSYKYRLYKNSQTGQMNWFPNLQIIQGIVHSVFRPNKPSLKQSILARIINKNNIDK